MLVAAVTTPLSLSTSIAKTYLLFLRYIDEREKMVSACNEPTTIKVITEESAKVKVITVGCEEKQSDINLKVITASPD